jgi:hypothetical protein
MSSIAVLVAAWLLVIGYGLVYVGYRNLTGSPVRFDQAFFGRILGSSQGQPSSSGGAVK